MQDQTIEEEQSEDRVSDEIRMAEVGIMMRLLHTRHNDVWTRAELERHVGGNMLDFSDALLELQRSGLVHLEGELVTVSRAARRMDDIAQLV
jgi:hypothetical protein